MPLAMRHLGVLLALCVCLCDFAHGGTFSLPTPENPEYPGMCYDRQQKKAIAVGESFTDHSDCTRMTCFKSNTDPPEFSLQGATCSYAKNLPVNCRDVPGDPAADYPDCCSEAECDGPPQGTIRYVG